MKLLFRVLFLILILVPVLHGSELNIEVNNSITPTLTIRQIMESVITPATNRIWGTYEPSTDQHWDEVEQAAIETIIATTMTSLGGIGPNDMESINNPEYQILNQEMLDAANNVLRAAQNQDQQLFAQASDDLFSPCESCHLKFHPGMSQQ